VKTERTLWLVVVRWTVAVRYAPGHLPSFVIWRQHRGGRKLLARYSIDDMTFEALYAAYVDIGCSLCFYCALYCILGIWKMAVPAFGSVAVEAWMFGSVA
jgi:hypothetical protein